jgi:hypothetical protein
VEEYFYQPKKEREREKSRNNAKLLSSKKNLKFKTTQ